MGNPGLGLRGVFANAIASVLAVTCASGCGDEGVLPGIEAEPGFVPVACNSLGAKWLDGLSPTLTTEYLELRERLFDGSFRVVEALGTPCAGAVDLPACEAAFAGLAAPGDFQFGACVQVGLCRARLAATQGDTPVLIDSVPELASFLAPIDTPAEAMLLAQTQGVNVSCDRGGAKADGDGFLVQAFTYPGCNGRTRHLIGVDAAGNVITELVVDEKQADRNCVIGRRPPGLEPLRDEGCRSALGRYWADAARLEAASIAAFRRLRRELRLHGAPRRLLDSARRAARDEVRHARVVGALARGRGAQRREVRITPLPLRDLEAIAVENAAEGCVRETFGALVGSWQARFARDPAVRAAYGPIAEDELRHATLAWEVAEWSERRLDAAARARVRAARDAAVAELFRALAEEPERDVAAEAGVPRAAQALALAEQLRRSIWS